MYYSKNELRYFWSRFSESLLSLQTRRRSFRTRRQLTFFCYYKNIVPLFEPEREQNFLLTEAAQEKIPFRGFFGAASRTRTEDPHFTKV